MTPTPTYPDLYAQATALVKGRVERWPSAYASGQVVREYKRLAAQRHGSRARPYAASAAPSAGKLARWFREKWVDLSTGQPCGSVRSAAYYPVCRPESVARALSPRQRDQATGKDPDGLLPFLLRRQKHLQK